MMDYEPITKGLRWRLEVAALGLPKHRADGLLAECDNIDAIHRSLEQENERLRDASERGDDCIKLPVDADGVPIHIGDWIVNPDISNQKQKVAAIAPDSVYWWGEDGCHWRRSHHVRHYRPDTWERIIEDAINTHGNGFNPCWTDERDKLVARCKALCERTGEGEE